MRVKIMTFYKRKNVIVSSKGRLQIETGPKLKSAVNCNFPLAYLKLQEMDFF